MRRTVRVVAIAAILSLLAVGGWVWSGGSAHAAQPASIASKTVRAANFTAANTTAANSTAASSRATASMRTGADHRLLSVAVAPSVPSDPAIFGVNPGSIPWMIKHGRARLSGDGALQVNVVGLVLTTTGANPVPFLAASVYCNGALAAISPPAPYSTKGNARIRASVTLPAFCPAPAVLLNPATGSAPSDVLPVYIGFGGTA